jgi:DNA-binding transcriptional regulator/RsmH inhibitor MraZ
MTTCIPEGELQFPVGRYPAFIDNHGRLKLPAIFNRYFNALATPRCSVVGAALFATSIDRVTLRVYPLNTWLKTRGELTRGKRINLTYFNGEDLGSSVTVDRQGRIMLNSELRKALGIVGSCRVHLFWEKEHLLVLADTQYQALLKAATKAVTTDPVLKSIVVETPPPLRPERDQQLSGDPESCVIPKVPG